MPTDERFESFEDAGINLPYNASGEVDVLCPECSGTRRKSREKCLSVNVGEGVWHCHNCGWDGRIWLPERPIFAKRPAHKLTVRKPQPPPDELHPAAVAWFATRGIPESVLRANGVTADEKEVRFPYYVNGELINVKHRSFPDKRHRMEKGADVAFFNIDRVGESESLVIVEGEFDALALQAAGVTIPVISVPNGVNSKLDACFANAGDVFDRVQRVVLAGDGDEAGRKLTDELARRIGREKCFTVTWEGTCKDANDTLLTWGADVVADCLNDAMPYPIEGVIRPGTLSEAVMALRAKGPEQGVRVSQWPRFSDLYRATEGQLTIVTGVPNHGKSAFLDNLLVGLAKDHGWRFAVCSPENFPPELHVANLVQIYANKTLYPAHSLNGSAPKPMTEEEINDAVNWVDRHFSLVLPDPMRLGDALDLAGTLIRRDGVRGVVLDPWNRLGHSRGNKSETDYISEQLAEVKQFAARRGVHVWVVAHPTKIGKFLDKNRGQVIVPRVRPYDISGSHAWADMGDMILCVHRDFEANETSVFTDKVRFRTHGELGEGRFRFDIVTGRYVEL